MSCIFAAEETYLGHQHWIALLATWGSNPEPFKVSRCLSMKLRHPVVHNQRGDGFALSGSEASLLPKLVAGIFFFFFPFCLTNLAAQRRNKLTHVGEQSLARGGGEGRAGWRRQLGRAIALRHTDYGVGVAAARFTSITVWQAWAIASEKKKRESSQNFKRSGTEVQESTRRLGERRTYSKPFFGKVFLSVCKLLKKNTM